MICWNWGPPRQDGRVTVFPHPDTRNYSQFMTCSTGAPWTHWRKLTTDQRKAHLIFEV